MGVIKIIGSSQRNVSYDIMNISVTFNAWDKKPSTALKQVNYQSERFLSILNNDGFDISRFRMSSTESSQSHEYLDENNDLIKQSASASISIEIPIKYDLTTLDHIKKIIISEDLDADLDIRYHISNLFDIRKELLKEAISDSRAKAEIIASEMDQKLIGIDKVLFGDKYERLETEEEYFEKQIYAIEGGHMSNKLSAGTQTLRECVEVDWIIE